jgi:hypothetical protein
MTDHYYTFAKKVNDSISVRFIFLDTPPLVAEYHNRPDEYPEVARQDTAKEIKWLKGVLENSKEQWKLVFGHHPVYSASKTHGNTKEMIERVKPLLEKYHAQFTSAGMIMTSSIFMKKVKMLIILLQVPEANHVRQVQTTCLYSANQNLAFLSFR